MEEEIEDLSAEEERSGEPDLPPKAADIFAVFNNFDRHSNGGRYLYRAVVLVRRQRTMDGGMGTQHPEECTRD